jgi:beta-glucosidase
VQLYVRQPVASISRPVRQLKTFEKVMLKAGSSQRVSFTVPAQALGYHNAAGRLLVEAGGFEVHVGTSSITELKGEFSVSGSTRDGVRMRP